MLCADPYMMGVIAGKCGQCPDCKSKHRRTWRDRLILESFKHDQSSFVTLTYNEENYNRVNGNLHYPDVQLWLKRLRRAIEPQKIRYFISGEYGDKTWRPHYHAALFGLMPNSGIVNDTWSMGFTQTGILTPESCAYVAGYVTKKLDRRTVKNADRVPERSWMSLRPGIGAGAMDDVASLANNDYFLDSILESRDVPASVKVGSQTVTFGRYLRSRLRSKLGHDKKTPPEALEKYRLEMLELLKSDKAISSKQTAYSIGDILVDIFKQDRINSAARREIFQNKGKL